MATPHDELIRYARVFMGDVTPPYDFHDDVVLMAARVATGFIQNIGYDQGHTSSWTAVTPALTEKEKVLWAKAIQILVRNPKALDIAMEAVSVRTEEVSYSTEAGGRIAAQVAKDDLDTLRSMIYHAASTTAVATRPDFGLQLGKSSAWRGLDPFDD